jgi:hypothetical protein
MNVAESRTYTFAGQEDVYARFRPNWTEEHALWSLRLAGISRHADGDWSGAADIVPVVASLGAGTGSDAATFKRLGCHVILVEPNERFLEIASASLSMIDGGSADFVLGGANSRLGRRVDLVVAAQSLHTFKTEFSAQHLSADQVASSIGAEEAVRQALLEAIADRERANFAVWYYNPDAREASTRTLHRLLRAECPKYALSNTPLVNAAYFQPNHFQPWLNASTFSTSPLFKLLPIVLAREEVKDWLSSYSFKPDPHELDAVVDCLQHEWFDRYASYGQVALPYVSVISQGPLRHDAFPMNRTATPIGQRSPLDADINDDG